MPALFSAPQALVPSGSTLHAWTTTERCRPPTACGVWRGVGHSLVHSLTADKPMRVVIATHLDYLDEATLTRVLQVLDAHTDRVRTMISAGDVVISGSASKDGTAAIWEADRIWVD